MAMPIRIEAIEAILVDLPTIRPHRLSMTTMRIQTLVIVRLRCLDGVEGLGEATTIGGLSYGAESPEAIKSAIDDYLAPLLIEHPVDSVRALRALMRNAVRGNGFARSALETAWLDAQGKRLGLPLNALLGGALHQRLPVAWTLASGDTERDIAEAEQCLEQHRHQLFKLKIGSHDVAHDVRHVSAIKQALGERAEVRVDVNQAWSEAEAIQGIGGLEAAGVTLIEQPVDARLRDALARLSTRFDVAVMADEAVCDARDGFVLAAAHAADVFALKLPKAGGPLATLELAAIAEAAGVGLYGGTMLEGTIGTAASLHVFSTLERIEWGTELFGPRLLVEDIVSCGLDYAEFGVGVPTGPGLGVELDEARLARYRRR